MINRTCAFTAGLTLWAAGAIAADAMPSSVALRNGVFTDSKGMTLYIAGTDRTPNTSDCYDNCVHNWPAFNAAEGDRDSGGWKIIIRADGTKQWAYRGKPVYRFLLDRDAGDIKGDGIGNVWHAVRP
ncbi:MAG TPA: hypothetical protein VFW28_17655 [Micropepsaceae bacterium]|nr:hypothetical protein [Micropepsaceae bacterium]